jgi:sensor c-di-GMP phosphodiesterase-like protein
VLAEGIEKAEQRQTLVELGCDRGQGFLFCRPIPAEDFNALYISDPGRQAPRHTLAHTPQSKKLTDGLIV